MHSVSDTLTVGPEFDFFYMVLIENVKKYCFFTQNGKNWLFFYLKSTELSLNIYFFSWFLAHELIRADSILRHISRVFSYVKHGSSIITSKILSKILSNENRKTGVARNIVCFGILIQVLSWRHQKHQCFCFRYWDFLTNFWRNNWQPIFDIVERLLL